MSSEFRKKMASLPFGDKLRVLEKLRDRESAIAKARETMRRERLIEALETARDLLHKYDYAGQADVIERILTSLHADGSDYQLLSGVDMWGGSGAVWDVSLCQPDAPEHKMDRKKFWKAIVAIAREMDGIGVGTPRSRQIADVFQHWLNSSVD